MKDKALREVIEWLDNEINTLNKEISARQQTINQLTKLTDEIRQLETYADYKDRYDNLSTEYEKEKERLIKLHNYYKKTETESEELRKKLKVWADWFNSNKEIFDRLFSAAPPAGATGQNNDTLPQENSTKKKKLKFKNKKDKQ